MNRDEARELAWVLTSGGGGSDGEVELKALSRAYLSLDAAHAALESANAELTKRVGELERRIAEPTALRVEPCERCELDRDGFGFDGMLPPHTCAPDEGKTDAG